jgi:hypothetical protein
VDVCYLPRSRTAGTRLSQVSDGVDVSHRLKLRTGNRWIAGNQHGRIIVDDTKEAGVTTRHNERNEEEHDTDQERPPRKNASLGEFRRKWKGHTTLTVQRKARTTVILHLVAAQVLPARGLCQGVLVIRIRSQLDQRWTQFHAQLWLHCSLLVYRGRSKDAAASRELNSGAVRQSGAPEPTFPIFGV